MQLTLFESSDPLDDDVSESMDRLTFAGQRMVEAALLRGGVPIGRPDDLPSETLAAFSLGAEPTEVEKQESRRYTRGRGYSPDTHGYAIDRAFDDWSGK